MLKKIKIGKFPIRVSTGDIIDILALLGLAGGAESTQQCLLPPQVISFGWMVLL